MGVFVFFGVSVPEKWEGFSRDGQDAEKRNGEAWRDSQIYQAKSVP